MKKIILFSVFLFLGACATPLEYDHEKISVDSGVNLSAVNTQSRIRERDGQILAQISGTAASNQSVYYKFEWFDSNGMKISTGLSRWKKVNLRKNVEFFWNAAAPSKRAVAYKVYITDDIGNGIIE